jgi:hypothetical protein
VGFFSQVIVPRLCDFLLNKSLLARHRRQLLAGTLGDVLEIRFGTGLDREAGNRDPAQPGR